MRSCFVSRDDHQLPGTAYLNMKDPLYFYRQKVSFLKIIDIVERWQLVKELLSREAVRRKRTSFLDHLGNRDQKFLRKPKNVSGDSK